MHRPFAKSISKNLINSFSLIVNFRDDAWLWVAICLSLWILATFGDITMICMQDRFSVLRCVRILALGGPYFLMFNWWLSLNWTHRKQLPIDILLIYAVLKLYWEIIWFFVSIELWQCMSSSIKTAVSIENVSKRVSWIQCSTMDQIQISIWWVNCIGKKWGFLTYVFSAYLP